MRRTKVVGVIIARMSSKRFPNKIISEINGQSTIELIANRVRQVSFTELPLVLATTDGVRDDLLETYAYSLGLSVFRGPESDVLARVITAGTNMSATHILRLNGDCPLVEPTLIEAGLKLLYQKKHSLVSSKSILGLPYGVSVEIVDIDLLQKLWPQTNKIQREHIFNSVYEHLSIESVSVAGGGFPLRPDLRLTVDIPGDNQRIGNLIELNGSDPTLVKYWDLPFVPP